MVLKPKFESKKPSWLPKNLKYLRSNKGLSVDGMAKELEVAKPTYYSWERGDAEPGIHMLLSIAGHFDLSVDELLRIDISIKNNPGQVMYEVELVPHKAVAGYSAFYADPAWRSENLETIKIPFKPPKGEIRAFPVEGDSMVPKVSDGAYIVAIKLEDLSNEVKEGTDYIVVTRDNGIVYKKIEKKGEVFTLSSFNSKKHPPFDIDGKEIIQLWKFFCVLDKHR